MTKQTTNYQELGHIFTDFVDFLFEDKGIISREEGNQLEESFQEFLLELMEADFEHE